MTFIDKQIRLEVFNPRVSPIIDEITATVNDEIEFANLPSNLVDVNIDLSADSFQIGFDNAGEGNFGSSTFNGYVLSDVLDNIPSIKNVTIDNSVTTLGIRNSDLVFTENTIEIDVEGLSYNSDSLAKFNVEFGEPENIGFLDNSIELEVFNPRNQPISEKIVATVNDGFEFTRLPESTINNSSLVNVNFDFDVDDILLEFTDAGTGNFDSSSFNGYVFSDISGTLPAITNVTIDSSETTLGLEDSDLIFTEDTIEINVESLSYTPETRALLNVEFEQNESNDSQIIELFRFRNITFDTGTYVFVGAEERDDILEGENLRNTFSLDGREEDGSVNIAFEASLESGDDLIPFYRLKSLDVPGTFLFVSTAEYNAIFDEDSEQQDKWEQEGLDNEDNDIPEFYLLDSSASRGTEFNRFQNTQNGTFLYAGPTETENIQNNPNLSDLFTNQGVAFKSLG